MSSRTEAHLFSPPSFLFHWRSGTWQSECPLPFLSSSTLAHLLNLLVPSGKPGEVREAVKVALETGYRFVPPSPFPPPPSIACRSSPRSSLDRHLDCAWAYKNEAEVGQGIKDSGVPRSEIFITTKVSDFDL